MAGAAARGATAYVTLEPCCHWGQTPPCTDALIEAGVARVVIAMLDPDKRVDSRGVARLREAGIAVDHGLLEAEAGEDQLGFVLRVTSGRPLVTLKLATSLDGKIATSIGESQWITGPQARHMAHALRGRHDAVLAGVGTVVADNPELTCRIEGFRLTPVVRVIVDSHLRTPLTSKLAQTAAVAPLWFLVRNGVDPVRRDAFAGIGAKVIDVAAGAAGVDLAAGLAALAQEGLTRVLVEGGGQVAASLIRADLIDRLAWFHAPAVMGGDGWPGVQGFGAEKLAMLPRFVRTHSIPLGGDMLTEFKRPS
jgi:diaminohydroxyphosphoribosylaminopyrimidine deaminase/5-amino-6-(5-phosphoribosylamino)uracil reductase